MWLFVHDAVLKEALHFFSDSFSETLQTALLEGGRIPDIPCISFDTEKPEIAACNLVTGAVHQLNLILPNQSLTITYQYNIGFLALLHAMSNSVTASKSNQALAKQIVTMLSGLFFYALQQSDETLKGKFIGMVIHCIIDSYAPAHSFRISKSEMKFRKRICHVKAQLASQSQIGDLIAKKLTHMKADEIVNDPEIVKYFKRHEASAEAYYQSHKTSIITLAKHIKFFTSMHKKGQRIKCHDYPTRRYHSNYSYIFSFQNIANGVGLKHMYHDRAWRADFAKLKFHAIADVVRVLMILKTYSSNISRAVCEFQHLLTSRTFAIIAFASTNRQAQFSNDTSCLNYE